MMDKEQFIEYVLSSGADASSANAAKATATVRPKGFAGKGFQTKGAKTSEPANRQSTFAKRLLEAAGFGAPEEVARATLIRGDDAAAKYLPERVFYWPKSGDRPYQTLLFEADINHGQLLEIPAFRNRKMQHLDMVEDALARLVQQALKGFERGGEGVTAAIKKGRQDETLCVISIIDQRESHPVRLVCFGTVNSNDDGLETFQITEQTRFWEPQLARDYLGLLYLRQFGKLEGRLWQEAFTTTEERRLAQQLLDVCSKPKSKEAEIQVCVLNLLDEIAKSFGVRRKPGRERRLQAHELPPDHDIGTDSENVASGSNPFQGVAIQDEKSRLLGYIVYCLDRKKDAQALQSRLQKYNRFHNVLVVYPHRDEAAFELWQGNESLVGKLKKDGAHYVGAGEIVNLLSRFFVVSKAKVNDPKGLALELAYRARYLRMLALRQLKQEDDSGNLSKLHEAFRVALVHNQSDDEFADAFAQTLTYGLLTARWISKDDFASKNERFTRRNAFQHLHLPNNFLRDFYHTALKATEGNSRLDWLLDDIAHLLDRVAIGEVFARNSDEDAFGDPVIHFYEPFLSEYDPKMRQLRGVYYTPRPVVSYIVRSVHEILITHFGIEDGLASAITWKEMSHIHRGLSIPKGVEPDSPFVQILDPATGTGTFLVEIIDVIFQTLTKKWDKKKYSPSQKIAEWQRYVTTDLLPRLHGYELMMAPYAIAHMKVGLKLRETGYEICDDATTQIFLTDSLEPHVDLSARFAFDVPALAREAKSVNLIKERRHFTVVVGNPPYLREKERGPGERDQRIGGWVRFGNKELGQVPLFDDFIRPLSKMKQGVHAKLAYELSVMFWRLAVWLVFEKHNCPGVVGFVSPRAYIAGPGHGGMREWIRSIGHIMWLLDLGGDNRGTRKSDNVFDIETGVTIGLCAKIPGLRDADFRSMYQEISGTTDEKLASLRTFPTPNRSQWRECATDNSTFLPVVGGQYSTWPQLTDMFPWQHSGTQFKRLWPIGESREVLEARWRRLLAFSYADRAKAFVETDARLVAAAPQGKQSLKYTGIGIAPKNSPMPHLARYCYRSLDRQWAFLDERLADRLRPTLFATLGPKQVFAATLMSKPLGSGTSVSISSIMPDLDVFCNRGAKDIVPLWRDSNATVPNVTPGLIEVISSQVGRNVLPEDVFCYCVAALASPTYSTRFEQELATPGPRIPLTKTAALFSQFVLLGARIVWLQTFGERWLSREPNKWTNLVGSANVTRKISYEESEYPEAFSYDAESRVLTVGNGQISGVSEDVYSYSVSGFSVVQSWLRYRMKRRGGRARRESTRSVLDEVRPRNWTFTEELLDLLAVIEGCVALWPEITSTLDRIVSGPLFTDTELPKPSAKDREEPKVPSSQNDLPLFGH